MLHTANREDDLKALLAQHRAALEEVVSIAAQSNDRVARIILTGLSAKAHRMLRAIDKTLALPLLDGPFNDFGKWGENGCAPKIADMLRSARFHANRGGVANLPARLDRIAEARKVAA